ncbi:sugar ABC transporter ATP-binding protein [Lacisediminihabitans profunda]|uniref:Sugar ABC transporter ATP-binding protein n=1 Tax=Lacisediminihabitans profunda TaxID=2594790 RepID=A0A5C8UR21_9MICO|nr:sugar ABC transporter ATP-binding protein [Lacisediminihabitans profunda]TXN30390.1 sugar ABC transporter ATP-binding protein [Lacisediminihabitans profunda]
MVTTTDSAGREIIAQAVSVTRKYPGVTALDSVDFEIHAGEVRALLGQNGAGKSTLIRLLSGVDVPSSGTIRIGGRDLGTEGVRGATERGVATCYQELSLVAELTVAENFFLGRWPKGRFGIDSSAMINKARQTLARLGSDIDPTVEAGNLTLAQQQIVEIARALQDEPKLLILDEPTSALAHAEVALVLETVRRVAATGVAVIYVSHRMDEIRQIAESATIMRNGRVIDTVKVGESDTAAIIRLMLGTDPNAQKVVNPTREFGDVMLEVKNLTVLPKVTDVSFAARAGEIVGIAGLLGSGRSELLRAIAGFDRLDSGTVLVAGIAQSHPTAKLMRKAGIGLTPEDRKREGVLLNLGIDENIVMSDFAAVSRGGILSSSRIRKSAQDLAKRFQIKAHDLSEPIETLSGGNQQKAVIARWIHAGARVLLLDEPTRGVDVEAKGQIYAIMRAVADQGKTVVFVSSEVEELPLACDRVLVLRDGAIQQEFTAPDINLSELLEASMASHV